MNVLLGLLGVGIGLVLPALLYIALMMIYEIYISRKGGR